MILVIMGVTGAGKSTIGHLLSDTTGWPFADGDDYHPEANKQKMHSGIPLTDEDRIPWLTRLHELLAGWDQEGKSGILACSALKESYRQLLSSGIRDLHFVLLEAPLDVLEERLQARTHHFMNPELLASQISTLEVPSHALHVSMTGDPKEAVNYILCQLKA